MDFLPNEILYKIVKYLCIKDTKNISETSQRLYDNTLEQIWSTPRFHGNRNGRPFLEKISEFPIKELHTSDFNSCCSEIIEIIPDIELLHIDNEARDTFSNIAEELCSIEIPVVLHTKALGMETSEDFDYFVEEIVGSCPISELIIDHVVQPWEKPGRAWTTKQFDLISDKVFIGELSLNSFSIPDFDDFFMVLCKLNNANVRISNASNYHRLLTIQGLDMLKMKNIKVQYVRNGFEIPIAF
eukprot:TCONS_00059637-protein